MTYNTLTSTFALSLFLVQSPVLASETILEVNMDLSKSIHVLQDHGLDEEAIQQIEAATKSGATSEEIDAVKTQLAQVPEAQEGKLWAAISYLRNYLSRTQAPQETDEKKPSDDVKLTPQTETLSENVEQTVPVSTQNNAEAKDVPEATSQASGYNLKFWTWNWRSSGETEEVSKTEGATSSNSDPVTTDTTPTEKKDQGTSQ